MPPRRPRIVWFMVAAVVTACSSDTPAPTETEIKNPFPGVTAALNIDLNNLPNYANTAWPVHFDLPARAQDNSPASNPVTDRGATLGRVLFHDKQLSINNTVSCAGCHQNNLGFSDAARLSVGFNSADRTTAHAMRLANARFYQPASAFWDRRAPSLEAQATQPIQNAVEMGFDGAHGGIAALTTKMRSLAYYPELFTFVFGDATITEDRIQRALAQYVRSIVSADSRFDQGFAQVFNPQLGDRGVNTPFPAFSAQENRGKQLFFLAPQQGGGGCVACHTSPTFALAANSRSNGLDVGETQDFKSPSLKNVAVTGPYMHDGRFATLDQVIEHYVSGVQPGPALDNKLRGQGGQPLRLQWSAADKAAVVAFLASLTDNNLLSDSRFSDPFKK